MHSKSQIVAFISILPIIALLPRFSRGKKYFYVVGGFAFTCGALCYIIGMKMGSSHDKYMPGIKASECALGTENFNPTTGNTWVYMVKMSR